MTDPRWNASNLESEGVKVDEATASLGDMLLVDESHPAIELMHFNATLLGMDVAAQPKVDGRYYRISRSLMEACCRSLRDHVYCARPP